MPVTETQIYIGVEAARRRVIDHGHRHLLANGLNLQVYDAQRLRAECPPDDRAWLGRYVPFTIRSRLGPEVHLNVERHDTWYDLADTVLHEVGHALWEMLSDAARAAWETACVEHPQGPEEGFCDEFMYSTNQPYLVRHPELLSEITTAARK